MRGTTCLFKTVRFRQDGNKSNNELPAYALTFSLTFGLLFLAGAYKDARTHTHSQHGDGGYDAQRPATTRIYIYRQHRTQKQELITRNEPRKNLTSPSPAFYNWPGLVNTTFEFGAPVAHVTQARRRQNELPDLWRKQHKNKEVRVGGKAKVIRTRHPCLP